MCAVHRRFTTLRAPIDSSVAGGAALRDPGTQASVGGCESIAPPAGVSDRGGSHALGGVVATWSGWRPALVLVKPRRCSPGNGAGSASSGREVLTASRSPWQNAYVERLIGSIRRGWLDHVIVLSGVGLRVDPRQNSFRLNLAANGDHDRRCWSCWSSSSVRWRWHAVDIES